MWDLIMNFNENATNAFSLPEGQEVHIRRAFVISFLINHKCGSTVR